MKLFDKQHIERVTKLPFVTERARPQYLTGENWSFSCQHLTLALTLALMNKKLLDCVAKTERPCVFLIEPTQSCDEAVVRCGFVYNSQVSKETKIAPYKGIR